MRSHPSSLRSLQQPRGLAKLARRPLRSLCLALATFWLALRVASAWSVAVFLHGTGLGTGRLEQGGLLRGLGRAHAPARPGGFLWMLPWLMQWTRADSVAARAVPPLMARLFSCAAAWLGGLSLGILAWTPPLSWTGSHGNDGIVIPGGTFLPFWAGWVQATLFSAFGLDLHAYRRDLLPRCGPHWPVFAGLGLPCFVLAGVLAEALAQPEASVVALMLATGTFTDWLTASAPATQALQLWMALAWHSASCLWSFALIGLFLRHGGHPRARMPWRGDRSCWACLVHLPVAVGAGALLYGAAMPPTPQIFLNVLATTAMCLASYHIAAHCRAVGR